MPEYKGVTLLEESRLGEFVAWQRLVLAHFAKSSKDVYALLVHDGDDAPSDDAIAAHDSNAGANILFFLGATMRSKYVRMKSGIEMWASLKTQFASWQASQAPVLLQRLRVLSPTHDEGVAAYCSRAMLLAADLEDVGRPQHEASFVDAVLQGLVSERGAWEPVLLGLRGALSGRETLREVEGRLIELEARNFEQLGPAHLAPHVPPSAAAAAAIPPSLEQRFTAMEAQLQQLVLSRGPGASNGEQRAIPRNTRKCHRCGSADHMVRQCPHPHVGHRAPPPLLLSCANEWALDSGATQHMSHGGGGGRVCLPAISTVSTAVCCCVWEEEL